MGPNPMPGVLVRRENRATDIDTRGEHRMKADAETGGMRPQAKE